MKNHRMTVYLTVFQMTMSNRVNSGILYGPAIAMMPGAYSVSVAHTCIRYHIRTCVCKSVRSIDTKIFARGRFFRFPITVAT